MPIDWAPLQKIIQENQRFVLTSHVRPDADAIGSELALAGLLEQLGKDVRIINPSATPNHLMFLDPDNRVTCLGGDITEVEVHNTDVHIVVDTSAWTQLATMGRILRASPAIKVVIDHHLSSDDLGAVEFKNTQAEATGALIFQLSQTLGLTVTADQAMALFCAIATDTGWYRFSSTTGETLRIAGQLIDLGASPHLIYHQLYEQITFARIQLTARVLQRVALDCDGRLVYTSVGLKDFEETGALPSETEDLVNECLKISGTECAFIAVEQRNRQIKISFRSRSGVNVAAVAEQFAGGGHRQAAGALLQGPLETAVEAVLTEMRKTLLDNQPA
ncbi:MAG: bifunctional oligoribonuclease/PAP phosphatase NrnA [Planctomycetota bacterium]|nr:bifunctional oligoribonuclease/PAP phosphatase NrnA [Planctomycetota bacterium]MDA1212801.1 bifunctional oligoribonuclease/PAP phosphatase NrnA [Planctomycetota bacterium]